MGHYLLSFVWMWMLVKQAWTSAGGWNTKLASAASQVITTVGLRRKPTSPEFLLH